MSVELNKGFAIVIDDYLNKAGGDDINKIVSIISEKGIPYCGYNSLPEALKCVSNFLSVNFIVLDWRLSVPENPDIIVTEEMKKSNAVANISFIKEFQKHCFAPVFIFSSESRESILEELQEYGGEDLITEDKERNFLFITNKADLLVDGHLFTTINEWIKNNPAIYTLKSWDTSFLEAKNKTFWHLFKRSPMWPKILWETYSKDAVNQSLNIMEIINKNIFSRTKLVNYDSAILDAYAADITKDELKEVIQGVMFMNSKYLHDKDLQPGDIFKIEGGKYLMNLRPVCDTVIGRMADDGTASAACDGEFYAIKGSKMTPKEVAERYLQKYEMLSERIDEVILYGVEEKEFFKFSFKKIYIHKFLDKRDDRKCRLLAPYINHVQQKYSAYVGRFGLPRTPTQIILDNLPA